jgi:hypothetical protein
VNNISDPFESEVRERWGETREFAESQRRLKKYSQNDIDQAKQELLNITNDFGELKRTGISTDSPSAMNLVIQHRDHISRWWYECTPEIQSGLADMYISDSRFSEYYEKVEPGLAQYVHDAIKVSQLH